jgi:hypothetical protein
VVLFFLFFFKCEGDVRALSGAYDIPIGDTVRERTMDLINEMRVEILPELAGFDVRVHPGKR